MKNAEAVVEKARIAFNSGVTKPYNFRLKQLKALLRLTEENEDQILSAIREDTRKPSFEAVVFEIDFMKNILRNSIDKLKEWMEPVKPKKPLPFLFDKVLIVPEPYGVVLVMSAWNYPFVLALDPFVGAIAAGNTGILKPSDYAPKCAALFEDLFPKYLDQNCYHVFTGGANEAAEILKQRFDYIFYTGGTQVGKLVHQAASKHLTPVTLELGGKNPVYIDKTANLEVAAARIMFGRLINSGQTCVAPDYVLCSKETQQEFITACWNIIKKWYRNDVRNSADFGRILDERHFQRIVKLLNGSNIAIGGSYDMNELFIEPTILTDVKEDDPIMQEEIFGPLLPILNVSSIDQALEFINKREKPLVIYVFSTDKKTHDLFMENTSSGNLLVNDTIMHLSCDTIPFGGVGNSGMGGYHGKFSFDTFSHEKGTLIRSLDKFSESIQSVRYPPYTKDNIKFIRKTSKKLPLPSLKNFSGILIFSLGVISTLMFNYILTFV